MSNVYSFNQVVELGIERRDYPFKKDMVLTAVFKAKLDFKIWSKSQSAINCYFTVEETGDKILVAVYRTKDDEEYKLPNCEIDFRECPIDTVYNITVAGKFSGIPKFKNAELV